MSETRRPHVGDVVVFHDPVARAHNALVTAVWSDACVNVVIVSGDGKRTDDYGRQTERHTSLLHKSDSPVHGMYWRFGDEDPNAVVQPQEK